MLADDFDTKLKNAWYQVPSDYDMVFLGCRAFCNTTETIPITVTKLLGKSPVSVDEKVLQVKGTVGTHGYIITFHVAKLLEDVPINWHADMELTKYIAAYNLNAYSIKPILIDVIDMDLGGSNLADTFPPLLSSLLNIRIFEQSSLAWLFNEHSLKIGSFNINTIMLILFFLILLLPIYTYKFIFLWLLVEYVVSKDIHGAIKYIAFLSIPMVIRYSFQTCTTVCKR